MRPHFPLASGRRAKLLAEARDEQPEEVARLERLYEMQEAAKDFAAVIYAASAKHEDLEGIAPTDPSDAEASTRATRDRLRASAARYRQQAQRVRLAQAAWERLAHALDEFNTQHPDEMNATSESTRQAWEKMAADNDLLPAGTGARPPVPRLPGEHRRAGRGVGREGGRRLPGGASGEAQTGVGRGRCPGTRGPFLLGAWLHP